VLAAAANAAAQPSIDELRIIAPAAPGGGWDQTARVMQQALQRAGLVRIAPVENVPGAAGTIGLARFIGAEAGRRDVVMVSGLIMLGGIVTHRSPVTLHDVTPLARLTGEYEVIAVPAASPFRTLRDLLDAFIARPGSISWGGGSAGGSDQILAGLVADAVGVSPSRVNYIAFSGGGESLAAILGGQVSVGINGLAEFAPQIEAGTLRPLAISSAERLPGVDVPTLREQGLAIEFENWRSLMAPAGAGRGRSRAPRIARGRDGGLGPVARGARALPLARSLPGRRRLLPIRRRRGNAGQRCPAEVRCRAGDQPNGAGAVSLARHRRATDHRCAHRAAGVPLGARPGGGRPGPGAGDSARRGGGAPPADARTGGVRARRRRALLARRPRLRSPPSTP
jgi:putative tricarboxylic transport membrane protein